MQVEGKGTIAIKTLQGDVKLLYDVQFVPCLAHNLLSVGQLMISEYKVVFDVGKIGQFFPKSKAPKIIPNKNY